MDLRKHSSLVLTALLLAALIACGPSPPRVDGVSDAVTALESAGVSCEVVEEPQRGDAPVREEGYCMLRPESRQVPLWVFDDHDDMQKWLAT